MSETIFHIEINNEGLTLINRFRFVALLVLVVGIIVGGLQLIVTLPRVIEANKSPTMPAAMLLQNRIYIVYDIVLFVLHVVQRVFYLRFATQARSAFYMGDSISFNRSFKWLIYQAFSFLAQVLLTLIFLVYSHINMRS